jgi:hypothetical protein
MILFVALVLVVLGLAIYAIGFLPFGGPVKPLLQFLAVVVAILVILSRLGYALP